MVDGVRKEKERLTAGENDFICQLPGLLTLDAFFRLFINNRMDAASKPTVAISWIIFPFLFLSYTINHRTGKWTEALMERRTLAFIVLQ